MWCAILTPCNTNKAIIGKPRLGYLILGFGSVTAMHYSQKFLINPPGLTDLLRGMAKRMRPLQLVDSFILVTMKLRTANYSDRIYLCHTILWQRILTQLSVERTDVSLHYIVNVAGKFITLLKKRDSHNEGIH